MNKAIFLKKKFFFSIFLISIDALNVSIMALILKNTMDAAIMGNTQNLKKIIYMIVLFMIEYSVISWGSRTLKAWYVAETIQYIRNKIFSSLMKKEFLCEHDGESSEIISLINNDLKMVEEKGIIPIFTIIRSLIVLLSSLIIMIYIQPIISIIAIVLSSLPIIVPKIWGKKLSINTDLFSKSLKIYNRYISDVFNGANEVKNNEIETFMIRRHEKKSKDVYVAQTNLGKIKAGADVTTNFVAVGMQFTVFCISGLFVIMKIISAGDVLAITQLMSKITNPVFDIVDSINDIKSVEKIKENLGIYLSENNTECNIPPSLAYSPLEKIELEKVSFKYNKGNEIISDISFCFEKGKKYAIVGKSGSGKTTLLKLIEGKLKNYMGNISYNNEKWTHKKIKKYLSIVEQDGYVFEGTILDNLIFDKNINIECLNNLIKKIGLEETLNVKGVGLEYQVVDNGKNLSGGEREKVMILRAILREKDWLIIDEGTAGLDNDAFVKIDEFLLNIEGITCIEITHRYNEKLLRKYNSILVISQGKLVEAGTFDELLNNNGWFTSIYYEEKDKTTII